MKGTNVGFVMLCRSFQEVSSRLQKSFASLKQMFLQGHGPVLDVIVQQAFVGIQTIYSVRLN